MSDSFARLEQIAEEAQGVFEAKTAARDQTLTRARALIRVCSRAIRAAHRGEFDEAEVKLAEAAGLAGDLRENIVSYPDLYHAGYTQDALKEYAEACLVYAMVHGNELPMPGDLGIEHHTYLKGLAEAASEMRRTCLDLMRVGRTSEAEGLLQQMDDIYGILVTMDYPDAITGGLRRLTDLVRGVTERTRGDLTLSLRQEQLEKSLRSMENKLNGQD